MKSVIKLILLLIIMVEANAFLDAQAFPENQIAASQKIIGKLEELEFENLRCLALGDSLFISFENREYRSDAEAAAVVLNALLPYTNQYKELSILYLKLGIPIIEIRFHVPPNFNFEQGTLTEQEFAENLTYSYSTSDSWNRLKSLHKTNTTLGKVDLEIEPKIAFQLGDFTIPFRFEIFLYPSLNLNLWKGGFVQASAYVPVYNYEFVNQYKYIHPHIISFAQNLRIADGNFLKLTAGIFSNSRLGTEAEYGAHLLKGRLILKASVAYTGRLRYLKAGHPGFTGESYTTNLYEYSNPDYLSYQVAAEARIPYTELAIQYGFGRYLHGENGHKLLIYRNFNEYIMGLQAYWGDFDRNFGFYVNLPLIPSKYYFNKKIRVKPSKYLNYSYLATSDYYWYFRTGYDTSKEYLELNPQVIMDQLPVYLLYVKEQESKLK